MAVANPVLEDSWWGYAALLNNPTIVPRYCYVCHRLFRSRCSSGSIVSDYRLDDRAIEVRSPPGAKDFPISSVSRPALGPTQPPVQWVPAVLSRRKTRPGLDADHSPHLVPKSRMSRSYTPLPPSATMACSGTALPFISFRFEGSDSALQARPCQSHSPLTMLSPI
jgi:hypothetical protein